MQHNQCTQWFLNPLFSVVLENIVLFLIDVHQLYSMFIILILEVPPEERHTVIIKFSFIDHSESRTLQQCINSVWLGNSLVWLKRQVSLNPWSPVETCWKSSSRHVAGYFSLMLFSHEHMLISWGSCVVGMNFVVWGKQSGLRLTTEANSKMEALNVFSKILVFLK